jgi:hypothetical protein
VTRFLRALATAILIASAVGVTAPLAGVMPVTDARAATGDLSLVTDATYTVNPKTHRVNVVVGITARNHTTETKTRKYYFDHAFLAVPPGTTGYRVSGQKGAKVRVAKSTKDATLLRVDFGSRLYSGKSQTYKLAFDILGSGSRANSQTRVGTGLITLPVWAYASNGASGSTVRVRFPKGWTVAVETGSFARRTKAADGGVLLESGPLANPLAFFAFVTAQQPAIYRDHAVSVKVGGQEIPLMIRAWRDDKTWDTRVGGLFKKGLPVLGSAIGIAWPHTDAMVVQEAVSRAAGGYAGLFDPAAKRIEVAYWADGLVALHEAAHGWFNGSLLAERWANEGFASLYAGRAASKLKVKGTAPALTTKVKAAAIPLNAWPALGDDTTVDHAAETYGYAASLTLAKAIAKRSGDDSLRRVWASAAAHVGAYQPPVAAGAAGSTAPELVDGPPDWRGILDLLEAETGHDFTDLWREWVVRPEEAPLLDARAEAQTSYQRTLALTGGWTLPRAIRDALRAWRFDTAEQLLADARTVIAQRDAVRQLAEHDGVTLPDAMRPLFESGALADASAVAEAQRNAILSVAQAAASRSADDDLLSRIGMVGAQPEADLAAARVALASGDTDAALAASQSALGAWTGAWGEGRRRAMLALAAVAAILVLVSAMTAAWRRRRGGSRGRRPARSTTPR